MKTTIFTPALSAIALATLATLPLAAQADVVANITTVTMDGATPTLVASGADVSGHVLVVSGYTFESSTGKAPTDPLMLQLTSSNQGFFAKPYSSGYNEEAYLALYDLLQKRPSDDAVKNLSKAGWVYLLDTTAIPSGTYTINSIQVGNAVNPQTVTLTSPFTFTVVQGKNQPIASISAVTQDPGGHGVTLTPVTSTLTPSRPGVNDFRFSGYGAQHDGVYRVKYPAMNPWGVLKDVFTDLVYQRPVITAKIINPVASGFPGYQGQVVINDTLTGQAITDNLGFVAAPLVSGSGKVLDVAVGSTPATGVLPYDGLLGKFKVGASRSPMGDITLWLNAPDAPNLKLTVSEPWDPASQMSLVQANANATYPVDVAPFDAQVVQKAGTDCSKVVLVDAQILGTSAGNIGVGEVLCGVRYTSLPAGIKPIDQNSVRLAGYLHNEGENRVEYDVGILYKDIGTGVTDFFVSGHKSLLATGLPIDAAAPVTTFLADPDLAALGSTLQAPLSFVGQNIFAARMKFDMPYPSFKVKISEPNVPDQEQKLTSTQYSGVLMTNTSAVWESSTVKYDVSYTLRPDKVWHYELPMTAVPRKPSIALNAIKSTLVSTSPVALVGKVGLLKSGKMEFNRAVQGDWRVKAVQSVVAKNASGTTTGTTDVDLTGDAILDEAGNFNLDAGKLASGAPSVAMVATLYRDGVSTGRTVRGGATVLTVNAGNVIAGTVVVQGDTSGKASPTAPFKPVINLQVDKLRQKDVGKVDWAQSTDDGATWTSVVDATTFGVRPALKQSGATLYRATIFNKYDNAELTTNTVRVEAFASPKVTIAGANAGFVGMPIALKATSDTPNTKFAWRVRSSTSQILASSSDDTLTFTPTAVGKYTVEIDANEDIAYTIDNVDRARHLLMPVSIIERTLAAPVITGPKIVETDKPATFSVKQASPFTSGQRSDATIVGKWILPDGRTVDGFEPVTFVVKPTDRAVRFESAIAGLEDSSAKASELALTPWTYKFPPMHVEAQVLDNKVPARVKYSIVPNNGRDMMNTGAEKFTYQWNLPANSSVVTNVGNLMTVEVTAEGGYQLTASASDTRGNSQSMTAASVTILPAPQLVASMKLTDPDPTHRAPDTLAARVSILSMPKNDSISSGDFYLDGVFVTSMTNLASVASIPVTSPGNHVITSRVTTKSGAQVNVQESFSLIDASAPACQIVASGAVESSLTLKAVCSVDMGKITGVKWYFDDHPTMITSLQANFNAATLGTIQTVRVVALSDKGKEGSAQWSRP